jgi:hypothetical protein
MTNFDRRIVANLEVALDTVCRKLPGGGDHETRKMGSCRTLGGSQERPYGFRGRRGRKALRKANRRSA